MSSRIALGTAQFGLAYGISNVKGQVAQSEVAQMLGFARQQGADTLDTAAAYGESEGVLGGVGVAGWRVFTKLPGVPAGSTDPGEWVDAAIRQSLARLRLERLAGVLLHNPSDLLEAEGDALYGALQALKAKGMAEGIGYSIYRPEELDLLFTRYPADVVQAPLNVFDQRLVRSGWLNRLSAAGTEIHTRSAFLQGLLLMEERPAKFARWAELFEQWAQWRADNGLSALEAALCYVLRHEQIDRVVVGAASLSELEQIFAGIACEMPEFPADLAVTDEDLVNPSRWAQL